MEAELLHNGNEYPSVPAAYSHVMKETYENMKIVLQKIPPLHIKLGLAKNFIKAIKKDKPGFCHFEKILLGLSKAKMNEDILNGPQITAILKDCNFKSTLNQK